MKAIKKGQLRVWWIPQVPMSNPFIVYVETIEQAKLILDTLAEYDLYQFETKVKPDYANMGGLEVFEEDIDGEGNAGWAEWHDEDDFNIDEHFENIEEDNEDN